MADREDRQARETTTTLGTGGTKPPGDSLGTALWLLARGLRPVAVSPPGDRRWANPGKSPIGKEWGRKQTTPSELQRIYARYPLAGVGVLLGPAGGIVDLETDDPAAAPEELARIFPGGVPETMGWSSARGEHRLFGWDERLGESAPTAVVSFGSGVLELRIGGRGKQLASVCPPSVAAGGISRVWNGCWQIAPCPVGLLTALRKARTCRMERRPPPLPRFRDARGRAPARRRRYGGAALARESELVRNAEVGGRNRTLNRAAFCLGQLVAEGAIDRLAAESALLEAALDCGLGPNEARATIRSGIEAGLERPRTTTG
jgi:hypothetical protein